MFLLGKYMNHQKLNIYFDKKIGWQKYKKITAPLRFSTASQSKKTRPSAKQESKNKTKNQPHNKQRKRKSQRKIKKKNKRKNKGEKA